MSLLKMIGIGTASRLLGVSVGTLRRMEENGALQSYGISVYYTPTGQRRYREVELLAAMHRNAKLAVPQDDSEEEAETAT